MEEKAPDPIVERFIEAFPEFKVEDFDIEEHEEIMVFFAIPMGHWDKEFIDITYEEFEDVTLDFNSVEIINNGHFRFTWHSILIIESPDANTIINGISNGENLFDMDFDILDEDGDVANSGTIGIGYDDLYSQLIDFKLHSLSDSELSSSSGAYFFVQIGYPDKRTKLSIEEESQLLSTYLFELIDSLGVRLEVSSIPVYQDSSKSFFSNPSVKDKEEKSEGSTGYSLKFRPLISFNEGINIFLSAIQTYDKNLKYLGFYQVMEFFSSIVTGIETKNLLVKKLDDPRALKPDGEYLDSIISMLNQQRNYTHDSLLVYPILENCIDLVPIWDMLPPSILKDCRKQIDRSNLDYDVSQDKIAKVLKTLTKVIYSTRNQVVHAKSNYTPTQNECPPSELDQMNTFMQAATIQVIRWYERLPDHQKG